MEPLDYVLGTLLETWNQRYQFSLNQEKRELTLNVPGFQLVATEASSDMIHLQFEEAGQHHRVECPVAKAPEVIEALLFPEEGK